MQIVTATMKMKYEVVKTKIGLLYVSAVVLLGTYLAKMKTLIQKDACTPVITAGLFTTAKTWKQPKCPSTNKWIKKMWYIYTMGYYSDIKRMKMSFAERWMDLEIIILSEVNQRQMSCDITYM
uniref:DUF1725 domain-containing protein n=1 Tax=Sus scrofa TaxID=9823 RepID=A0A8D1D1U0_PIG